MSTSKAPSLRVQNAARHKAILQHRRAAFNGALADATSDDRYSAEHKAELAAEARRLHSAWGRSEARDAWKEAAEALEGAHKDYQAAAAAGEKGWNYSRLAVLQEEYRAALSRPINGMKGETPAARALNLMAVAEGAGDAHRMRALRTAAVGLLDTPNDRYAGDLRQALARAEAAEVPEDVQAAAAEVQLLERVQVELRHEILTTEAAVTGAQPDVLSGGLTPWRRQVFGESEAALGGGVIWREGEDRIYG